VGDDEPLGFGQLFVRGERRLLIAVRTEPVEVQYEGQHGVAVERGRDMDADVVLGAAGIENEL
jgi:hypothetical protein